MEELKEVEEAAAAAAAAMSVHRYFDPEDHDLDKSFRLTKFSELKG